MDNGLSMYLKGELSLAGLQWAYCSVLAMERRLTDGTLYDRVSGSLWPDFIAHAKEAGGMYDYPAFKSWAIERGLA